MKTLTLAAAGLATLVAVPAAAAQTPDTSETKISITGSKLDVVAGSRALVRGVVRPAAERTVVLERRMSRGWKRLDAARSNGAGRFTLVERVGSPTSAKVRVRTTGGDAASGATGLRAGQDTRSLGRLDVYRKTFASYYGPGFIGGALACGGRLSSSTLGVAHKTLPCGTKVTFKLGKRELRVPVIDRGPYVGGRTWDLTVATKRKLGFGSTGHVLSTK